MSIVPVCRLDASDLSRLGNNVRPALGCRPAQKRRHRRQLRAVNRSLAALGEQVARLWPLSCATAPATRR